MRTTPNALKASALSLLVLVLFVLSVVGCSNQWRTGDPGITGPDMMQILSGIPSASTQSTGGGGAMVSTILAMKDQPGTEIFFAQAGSPQPNILSAVAFDTFDFLGQGQLSWWNISAAQVFFLDNPNANGGRFDGVILGLNTGSGLQYYGFAGQGQTDSGQFEATLIGDNGSTIVVRSFDVQGDTLNATIQLQVYETDSTGTEYYIGKFPSLNGFQ